MHIIHGLADELIPFDNAQLAYDTFISNGALDVNLIPIPESFGGHQDAAPFALLGAFEMSESMKIINELGDSNQDGMIDVLDILSIVNITLENNYGNYQSWAADINNDSNVDILDVIFLINTILNN